jgi:hypothetical protein
MTARYTVRVSRVRVVGRIWMPNTTAAMDYDLSGYDLENARDENGKLTRESIQGWLDKNAGDFQSVEDFEADLEDGDERILIPWVSEESEMTYNDCMFLGDDA